jgi:DNA-binding transcriptional LysR family regulator
MIEPRRLLTFREVARLASFSRAAEALSLTQPAVSQQVAALERQLGARLLDRGPGGPAVTDAGALLLAHADALAERLELADRQLRELLSGEAARLRVGAFSSAVAALAPLVVARLREGDPKLVVEVVEGSSPDLAAGVARGDLHAAICFEDATAAPREHEGAERRELGDEPMLAALPAGHRLAGRKRLRLAELADDTWTSASRGALIYRSCIAAGFEPRIAFLTSDPLAIRRLVAGGLAVTLIPRLLAGEFPGVAVVPLAGDAPRRRLYALTPAAGVRPAALAFVDEVRAALGAD